MAEEESIQNNTSCMTRLTRKIGCIAFLILLLVASFVLGAIYGRDVLPFLFERAHDSLEKVSEHAHDGLDKVNEEIEDRINSVNGN